MDYEQKYKEAIERAKIGLQECNLKDCDANVRRAVITLIHNLFPELKESEDEKNIKDLIDELKCSLSCQNYACEEGHEKRIALLEWGIAWLEKQGGQPTDKIDTKFKVGDWVILNGVVAKILDKQKYGFVGLDTDGKDFFCNYGHTDSMRLWTIQDIKGGDVLVSGKTIVLVKQKSDAFDSACSYIGEDDSFISCTQYCYHTYGSWYPATKEQRDLLFQKMKEAGYEWDTEKKELKKIESKKLDADEAIEWLEKNSSMFWESPCNPRRIIKQFKEDFRL